MTKQKTSKIREHCLVAIGSCRPETPGHYHLHSIGWVQEVEAENEENVLVRLQAPRSLFGQLVKASTHRMMVLRENVPEEDLNKVLPEVLLEALQFGEEQCFQVFQIAKELAQVLRQSAAQK